MLKISDTDSSISNPWEMEERTISSDGSTVAVVWIFAFCLRRCLALSIANKWSQTDPKYPNENVFCEPSTMSEKVPENAVQRETLIALFHLMKTAVEAHRSLVEVCGEYVLGRSQCCMRGFRQENFDLENETRLRKVGWDPGPGQKSILRHVVDGSRKTFSFEYFGSVRDYVLATEKAEEFRKQNAKIQTIATVAPS